MSDLTSQFSEHVSKYKDIEDNKPTVRDADVDEQARSRIRAQVNEFTRVSMEILEHNNTVAAFLERHGRDYIAAPWMSNHMTDSQRDDVDIEVRRGIEQSCIQIDELKKQVQVQFSGGEDGDNLASHEESIIAALYEAVERTTKKYAALKETRLKAMFASRRDDQHQQQLLDAISNSSTAAASIHAHNEIHGDNGNAKQHQHQHHRGHGSKSKADIVSQSVDGVTGLLFNSVAKAASAGRSVLQEGPASLTAKLKLGKDHDDDDRDSPNITQDQENGADKDNHKDSRSPLTTADAFIDTEVDNIAGDYNDNDDDIAMNMSEVEVKQLMKENTTLFRELDCLNDQVSNVESQVADIASLQQILTSRVMEQSEQIDNVYQETEESTQFVKAGARELSKATSNSSTFRMCILFVFVLASFSLLFLDWYQS